jgi:hypothetical protein
VVKETTGRTNMFVEAAVKFEREGKVRCMAGGWGGAGPPAPLACTPRLHPSPAPLPAMRLQCCFGVGEAPAAATARLAPRRPGPAARCARPGVRTSCTACAAAGGGPQGLGHAADGGRAEAGQGRPGRC